jgi:hypothetical protein
VLSLTNDQKYIADILEETKYLRVDQAHRLLKMADSEKDSNYAKRLLSQLQNLNRAYWIADDTVSLLHLRKAPVDSEMLLAVDVMLDMLDAPPIALSGAKAPFKLSFLAGREEDIITYGVAAVLSGTELELNFQLKAVDDDITIIFLLSDMMQGNSIRTKHTHYFAVFDGNKLRYFKGQSV